MIAEGSGPPVLLLHGSGPGTTAAAWAPLIAALAPHHRVIAPDLLGFGLGPRPSGSLRSAWTEQALELVDSLGFSTFAVVGNSAGGAIALSLACARPRAVTHVVAVGSMGHPMALPAGLDELWGYTTPSREAAQALTELINFDPRAATPEAIEARYQATVAQPWYPELFPAPRQRWVDDLSLTREELAGISSRQCCSCTARRTASCRCATASCRCSSCCRTFAATSSAAAATPRRWSTPTSSTDC